MNVSLRRSMLLSVGGIILAAGLAGCSDGEGTKQIGAADNAASEKKENLKPVTVTLFAKTPIPEENFQTYFVKPAKAKYPHITLEKIDQTKEVTIESLLAGGQVPDLIWDGLTNILTLTVLDVPRDMSDLAKKYKFDYSKFDQGIVNSIRANSSKGELLYFPYKRLVFGTHYNKSVFDKFGVPYPKNNMTWDEMIQLSKRLNNVDGGVQYQGINTAHMNRMAAQMSLSFVDPKTSKAVVQNEGWRKFFELNKLMFDNPGGNALKFMNGRNHFLQEQTLAMYPDIFLLGNADLDNATKVGLNWDVVTYPVVAGKPGVTVGGFADGFTMPKGSKHPDEAFQLLMEFVSESVQKEMTRKGEITSLNNRDILSQAYADNPLSKGKNIAALIEHKLADPYAITEYDRSVMNVYNKYLSQYATGKKDLNTSLREAEEEANKAIAEQQQQKK